MPTRYLRRASDLSLVFDRKKRFLAGVFGMTMLTAALVFSRMPSSVAQFAFAFFIVFGAQTVLWSIGIRAQVLGTAPALEGSSVLEALGEAAFRQQIGAHVAAALGYLKYAPTRDEVSWALIDSELVAATDLIKANAATLGRSTYVEVYLPFLERSAAIRAHALEPSRAIILLQELQQALGLPVLQHAVELSVQDESPPIRARLANMRVAVVDDDSSTLNVVQLFLKRNGADVFVASSIEGGVALLASKPDVVLADLVLDKESGYDFLLRIRREGSDVPVVALSGYDMSLDQLRLAGFASFISKPVTEEKLVRTLTTLPLLEKRIQIRKQADDYART